MRRAVRREALFQAARRGLSAVLALALATPGLAPTARAQTSNAYSASDYTTYYRWDDDRRLTMKIGPDPDGSGAKPRRAEKYSYNADGQVVQTEIGSTTQVTGGDFAASQIIQTRYDAVGNKTQVYSYAGTTAATLTQFSYDANDRPACTAVRMTTSQFDALYAVDRPDACAVSASSNPNTDRITSNKYDAAGQLDTVMRAVGTSDLQAYARYGYSPNGKQLWVKDAAGWTSEAPDPSGNRTTYVYDGFDRLERQIFPSKTTRDVSNTGDYEAYGYDLNGNRTSLRKRNNVTLTYKYDALNRQTIKYYPGDASRDVYTEYDLTGRVLAARFQSPAGAGVVSTYDKAGRRKTETLGGLAVLSDYDAAGNRIRMTWPGGAYVEYDYNAAGQLYAVREPAGGLPSDELAHYAYDALGRREGGTLVAGVVQATYQYDPGGRLNLLKYQGFAGGGQPVWQDATYNPASQVETVVQHNPALVWTGHPTSNTSYLANGLNQDAAIAVADGYDANGNLTNDGTRQFGYDAENRLVSVTGASSLAIVYDPLGRIQTTTSAGTTTRFLYDGDRLVGEYPSSGATALRRYAHGVGVDDPLVWYEGSGTSERHWLIADRQGSIVADATAGAAPTLYTYGPYGEAQTWAGSRFRYTGQIALPQAELYHYKARAYDPKRGWFLQTDPVGYKDDLNLYAYVGEDPTNRSDPTGLEATCISHGNCFGDPNDPETGRREQRAGAGLAIVAGVGGAALAWEGAAAGSLRLATAGPRAWALAAAVLRAIQSSFTGGANETPMAVIPGPLNSKYGKIDYLLGNVPGSVDSAGKGGFFRGVMGFDGKSLSAALTAQFKAGYESGVIGKSGNLEITSAITGANGKVANVLSAWQKVDEKTYKLVTAVPAARN
jgi:RHS repeat-associated protein